MVEITKKQIDDSFAVYIVKNPPPDFDLCLQRARAESEGRCHRLAGGRYQGLTIKEAILKDGREAVLEIYTYIANSYDPQMANSIREALKYFVKTDKLYYSLEDVIRMKDLFRNEIKEYENRYRINIEAELERLDIETKTRIRDYILY